MNSLPPNESTRSFVRVQYIVLEYGNEYRVEYSESADGGKELLLVSPKVNLLGRKVRVVKNTKNLF